MQGGAVDKHQRYFRRIAEFKQQFRSLSSDTIRSRLEVGSLTKEAAVAYREILQERGEAIYLPEYPSLDNMICLLRQRNQPVPRPRKLPTESDVREVERHLNVSFHPDYRKFLLQASDVDYGLIEPAAITTKNDLNNLVAMAHSAWDVVGLPGTLLPICEDNGDYYCMNSAGEVIFWSHNGMTDEKWPTLAVWIEQVWISGQ